MIKLLQGQPLCSISRSIFMKRTTCVKRANIKEKFRSVINRPQILISVSLLHSNLILQKWDWKNKLGYNITARNKEINSILNLNRFKLEIEKIFIVTVSSSYERPKPILYHGLFSTRIGVVVCSYR